MGLGRRSGSWRATEVFEGLMGWATGYIAKLKAGETVSFRPRGSSGRSGKPSTWDIVLCKVRGAEYLHIVKAIQGPRFQIGNNRGYIDGWVGATAIFGKLPRIES